MAERGPTDRMLRPSRGGVGTRVSYVELFYDLVFVFAITQIAHALIARQDLPTLGETLLLTVAMWWLWVETAWLTNWLNPDHPAVRTMLFALMLLGLVIASAIPEAFGDKAVLFAVAFAVSLVGRGVFAILAFRRSRPDHVRNFLRLTIWSTAASVFWVAGGFASEELRPWLWCSALAINLLAPVVRFRVPVLDASSPETWDVAGEHLAERVSLFIIIALGEAIILTGAAFATVPLDLMSALAFLAAFVSTVLMWLLYFNHAQAGGSRYIRDAAAPGPIARLAYTFVPALLVIGILLTAVADALVLSNPFGGAQTGSPVFTAALICGAPAVYLLGNAAFDRAIGRPWMRAHLVGAALLVVLVAAYAVLPPIALSWIANLVLLLVVIAEDRADRRLTPAGAPSGTSA